MTTSDDRLSRTASAIWRVRTWIDPMGDPSGDLGDVIEQGRRDHLLKIVRDAGYATPAEYNAEVERRMYAPGERMSLRVHEMLTMLQIDDTCPRCGEGLQVRKHYTRMLGGGWNTSYQCPACGWGNVAV